MSWAIVKDSRKLREKPDNYEKDKYDLDKAAKDIATNKMSQ